MFLSLTVSSREEYDAFCVATTCIPEVIQIKGATFKVIRMFARVGTFPRVGNFPPVCTQGEYVGIPRMYTGGMMGSLVSGLSLLANVRNAVGQRDD